MILLNPIYLEAFSSIQFIPDQDYVNYFNNFGDKNKKIYVPLILLNS